jgi:hypothetical protein
MIAGRNVPKTFWPEAVKWATYVMNRSPTLSVKNVTPEEAWSGIKPSVQHFRIFGCLAYAHIPDNLRTKLDNKSVMCIHLGVSDESKAYKLFDPLNKKIIISRDVVFDENKSWDWVNKSVRKYDDEISEIGESQNEVVNDESAEDNHSSHNEDANDDELIIEDTSSDEDTNNGANQGVLSTPRIRKPSVRLDGYVSGSELDNDDLHNLAVYSSISDPSSYYEAVKCEKWKKAMDQEIESIEANNTWELSDVPKGVNVIGVKWIYKTKINEKGNVEKYKARLVAKGYSQKHGVDFNEVFAPVARWDTIRAILAFAAKEKWIVSQLDVKSAFLHGELVEDIYVDQPLGYKKEGDKKAYKLKKALYGLKQAPRAWYSKIEAYFNSEKFEKCTHEHTLFVKYGSNGKLIIVSLYVDDLICTGNDSDMIDEFKKSMKSKFAMTDLGKMKFFLGIEVTHLRKEYSLINRNMQQKS